MDTLATDSRAGLAATLLAPSDAGIKPELARFGRGLALAAVFGLAVGARFGVGAMAAHAAGVPVALVAVAALGAPAFYVGLAHAGIHVDARFLTAAVARATATTGLVLAGLAAPMALLGLTSETALSVALYAAIALGTGGVLGLRALFGDLGKLDGGARARLVALGFALFATVLAIRVWYLVLPIFGGAR